MESIVSCLQHVEYFNMWKRDKKPGSLFDIFSQIPPPPNVKHPAPWKYFDLQVFAIIQDDIASNKPSKMSEIVRKLFPGLDAKSTRYITGASEYRQVKIQIEEFIDAGAIKEDDLHSCKYTQGSRAEIREKILHIIQTNNGKLTKPLIKDRIKKEMSSKDFKWLFESEFHLLKNRLRIIQNQDLYFIGKKVIRHDEPVQIFNIFNNGLI